MSTGNTESSTEVYQSIDVKKPPAKEASLLRCNLVNFSYKEEKKGVAGYHLGIIQELFSFRD